MANSLYHHHFVEMPLSEFEKSLTREIAHTSKPVLSFTSGTNENAQRAP
jgi:hypothetical protein